MMALNKVPATRSLIARSVCAAVAILTTSAIAAEGNPRVNQLGYLPQAQKIATYATNQNSPLNWQLRQGNTLISSGQTIVKGHDAASGEHVHHIDFTSVDVSAGDLRLIVGADQSYPFNIDADQFTGLAYDAIKYFYHNRSGIEIKTEFTGGGLGSFANSSEWARPAGHLNQGANKGDFGSQCWPGTCSYSLDVPYGWYDAGDHGKYVVNGGISVFKLANMFEASKHLRGTEARFADGTLNIPESGNGVDDILDEIRWQMEFMLNMQVPEGQPKAGMVHHKVTDKNWTGIPTLPHADTQERLLTPPSTAATLNVAATGAQCYRLFKDIDSAFASKCISVAERAWAAAKQNPNVVLPDGVYNTGGGEYGDSNLHDEFQWAAAELYISTGKAQYAGEIDLASITSGQYNWQETGIAGVMSLATVPAVHTAGLMAEARQKLKDIADYRLGIAHTQGYLTPTNESEFYWGSNNVIANQLSIIGLVYDFTGDDSYAQAVGFGVNYLLGQNALSNSYITGHGEKRSAQPHHRFWVGAKDSSLPWAPPGSLVGGPNVGLEDELSRNALSGCEQSRPQTCYLDDIKAWSTNEITVNWNSALAWVMAFWDDYAGNGAFAPQVSIAQPTANQNFPSGADVVVKANASDEDGEVVAVRFYVDGQLQSEDFTAPYELVATGLSDGLHSVTAIAEDDDVRTAETTVDFSVGDLPPEAIFTVDSDALTVTLNAAGSFDPDGNIISYQWDLGDGNVATGVEVEHTYALEGEYTVSLVVTDNDDVQASSTATFEVKEKPPVTFSCEVAGQPKFDIWNSGAIIRDVKITNISDTALDGWYGKIDTHVNVTIAEAWGGSASVAGNVVTVSGNDTLAPGEFALTTMNINHDGNFNSADCLPYDGQKKEDDKEEGDEIAFVEAESYTAMQGVETETTTDENGGLNVGWLDNGDWMAYAPITIPASGEYIIEYRVAGEGTIQFELFGGGAVFGQKAFAINRGWQGWETVSHTVTLTEGTHEFALAVIQGGFNINWFKITKVE